MRIVDYAIFECRDCERLFLFFITENDELIFAGQIEKGFDFQFVDLFNNHFTYAYDLKGACDVDQ